MKTLQLKLVYVEVLKLLKTVKNCTFFKTEKKIYNKITKT